MPLRQEKEDNVDAILDRVLDALRAEDVSPEFVDLVARKIASLRASPDISQDISTMAAKKFSLKEAAFAFGLKLTNSVQVPGQVGSLKWCIEDIPETNNFVCSPCLGKSFQLPFSRGPISFFFLLV